MVWKAIWSKMKEVNDVFCYYRHRPDRFGHHVGMSDGREEREEQEAAVLLEGDEIITWIILILLGICVITLVYAVLSAASTEDEIMEEFWELERWKENENHRKET